MSSKAVRRETSAEVLGKNVECPVKSLTTGLTQAILALENNRIPSVETKGSFTTVSFTYPPELLRGMRGLFPATKNYDFMIHSSATVASTSGGVINGLFAWNPSVGSYSEWSALAALFDEVRLLSSHLTWTTAFGPTSSAIVTQVSLAPDFDSNGSAPSGFTAVSRLAESVEFSVASNLNSTGSSTLKKLVHVPRRPYARTAVAGTSDPPSGCLGQWSWASAIVTTPSINYAFLVVRNIVRLRNRA
jgi:hypothetical protein